LCLRLRKLFPDSRVVAFDNLHRRGSELQVSRLREDGVEFVHGDVRNAEDLYHVGDIEFIVDAAAECSVLAGVDDEPGYVVRSNILGTVNCLEIARVRGAGLILLSSSRVYPVERLRSFCLATANQRFVLVDAKERRGVSEEGVSETFPMDGTRTLYGATKYAAELLALEFAELYGIPVVIDRCGVVAGPWQMAKVDQGVVGLWCARHVYGGVLSYIGHGGYQVRDVIHVEDLVDLLVTQMERLHETSGEVFNVGGGREVSFSLRELTALCQKISGNEINIGVVGEERVGDIPWYISDTSRVRERFGWRPTRSVSTIVADTVQWLEKHRETLKPFLQ